MKLTSLNFMIENLNPNNFESNDFNPNKDQADYKHLITRLEDIKKTIALLEKTLFR